MNRLEIIHLRSSGEPVKALTDRINRSLRDDDQEAATLKLYCRRGLDTDLAVHILFADVAAKTGPSALALRLASELRAFGLVEHTVWEEPR